MGCLTSGVLGAPRDYELMEGRTCLDGLTVLLVLAACSKPPGKVGPALRTLTVIQPETQSVQEYDDFPVAWRPLSMSK